MWDDPDTTTIGTVTNTDEFADVVSVLEKPPVYPDDVVVEPSNYSGIEYALVGMAVKYLYRFEMQRRNPNATIYTGDMIAQYALEYADELYSPVVDIFKGAKANCIAYANGSDSVELPTKECLEFARLENLVRSGGSVMASIDRFLGEGDAKMESDLESLVEIADPILTVDEYAVVTPQFSKNNVLADADFIIDDVLVDVKTTINPSFSNSIWRRLIGYLVLIDIHSNVNIETHGWTIEWPDEFGVYYSRSGDLQPLSTDPIYKCDSYPEIRAYIESQL